MKTSMRATMAAIVSLGMVMSACAVTDAPSVKPATNRTKNAGRNVASGCSPSVAPKALMSARSLAISSEYGASMTEAELFGLLHLTNSSDMEGGRVAQHLADDPQVKAFAGRMALDHLAMLQESDALAEQLNISPWLPAPVRSLALNLEATMDILKSRTGSGFDREYLDHEIALHRIMIGSMDKAGQVIHPELKQILQQALPALHAHLTAAQDLRETLSAPAPSRTRQGVKPAEKAPPCGGRQEAGRARH